MKNIIRNFSIVVTLTFLLCAKFSHSQSWTLYNSSNSGMLQNQVLAIAFQQDTTAWIGIKGGGIVKLKNGTWTQVDTNDIPLNYSTYVMDISVAPNNDVWVVGASAALAAVSGPRQFKNNMGWVIHPMLHNNALDCVAIDSAGIVWIGNWFGGGLFKYDGSVFKNFTEYNSTNPNDNVNGIGIVNNSKRWVCGMHEIGLMSDTSFTVFPYLTNSYPLENDIAVENDTLVWFASTLGLMKYDGSNWIIYNNLNSGMPKIYGSDWFQKIAIDKNNIKWLATYAGLVKFDGINWTTYNTSNSPLPSNKVITVEIGKDNSVWVGTDSGVAVLSNTLLPLNLLEFTAALQNENSVLLSWLTASEKSVSHFNIQCSTNGKEFTIIGKTEAKGSSDYYFTDNKLPNTNSLYYRLEIIDKNGATTFSNVQKINQKSNVVSNIFFPNPTKEKITISGSYRVIKIIDIAGKIILTKQLDLQQKQTIVNINHLTKGSYLLQCITNENIISRKLIIE